MSLEALTWAYKTTVGSPTTKAVLLALANYADEDDSAYPGIPRLAKMTELSERTVQRAVADLESLGIVRVEERLWPGRTVHQTNRYHLNLGWKREGVASESHHGGSTSDTTPGVTVTPNTKENTKGGHAKNVPAARVERVKPEPRRKAKRAADTDDEQESNRLPEEAPAPAVSIRRPTTGGLAKAFEREARTRYPLGDPRRITNMTALRANITRWRGDGIELETIEQAMEAFWASNMVREGQEPWKRFITTITVTLGKASAPDITNPDYYLDQQTEDEMDAGEKWLRENGLLP